MLAPEVQRKTLQVPLTPLIDVVFIMLLFFMLSSTFIRYQQIDFSSASSGAAEQLPDSRSLLVNADGGFEFEQHRYLLDSADSQQLFARWQAEGANVVVTARHDATIQVLVRVLDRLRSAGVTNLKLSESY